MGSFLAGSQIHSFCVMCCAPNLTGVIYSHECWLLAAERVALLPYVARVDPAQAAAQVRRDLLTLQDFQQNSNACYDRSVGNGWAVVDAHFHARPFGGPPVPFTDLLGWLRRAGILFTTLYGIGQRLPIDSECTYYLDCPGTKVVPSLKNDFFNAQSVLDNAEDLAADPYGPHISLSMSFLDLHEPNLNVPNITLLQKEFPGMFNWAGEINLVKQALWKNLQGLPVELESIKEWESFMAEFRRQDIPMALHADLGDDKDGLKFLPLMDEVLRLYPANKIIWVHMAGISKQLNPQLALLQQPVTIQSHVKLIEERLQKYPKLFIDLSWDVLYDELYASPTEESQYVRLINKYPRRFISGSDHLASASKTESIYSGQLSRTLGLGPAEVCITMRTASQCVVLSQSCLHLRRRSQQNQRDLSRPQ